ncbi:MAG: hypothetical protein ACLFV7_07725 [Phycisphaerae bacterium]
MTAATDYPNAIALLWGDMPRWDFKTARASLFRKRYPTFRPLGDFADEATELVRPSEDPDREWPVYGVNNETGVFLNQNQKGSEFNSPYKRIRKDWFFHNPTRANVGSLGRVPDVPQDAITSPEYQVWRTREGLLPAYAEVLLQMPFFRDQIECHRVGGVKERLFVQNLLEIPIPPLDERVQQAIVEHWNKGQAAASAVQQEAAKLEAGLEQELLQAVGISVPPPTPRRGAFAIPWSTFERWDTFFYRGDFLKLDADLDRLDAQPLGEVANFISRPWCKGDFPKGTFRYIEIAGVDRQQGITSSKEVPVEDAPSRAATLTNTGDLLLSTTRPYLGAFALVTPEYDRCVCSSGFAVIDGVDRSKIDAGFLLAFLKSPAGLRQMERRMTGGLYPAIVQSELEKIKVPLLPLPEQHGFLRSMRKGQQRIEDCRKQAQQLAEQTKAEVEAMILGKRPVF